jgi:hypothetical protein
VGEHGIGIVLDDQEQRPSRTRPGGSLMVKETKFFRKQARKADAAAFRALDAEVEADLRALARGFRSQADALKQKKKNQKAKPRKKRSTRKRPVSSKRSSRVQ